MPNVPNARRQETWGGQKKTAQKGPRKRRVLNEKREQATAKKAAQDSLPNERPCGGRGKKPGWAEGKPLTPMGTLVGASRSGNTRYAGPAQPQENGTNRVWRGNGQKNATIYINPGVILHVVARLHGKEHVRTGRGCWGKRKINRRASPPGNRHLKDRSL